MDAKVKVISREEMEKAFCEPGDDYFYEKSRIDSVCGKEVPLLELMMHVTTSCERYEEYMRKNVPGGAMLVKMHMGGMRDRAWEIVFTGNPAALATVKEILANK